MKTKSNNNPSKLQSEAVKEFDKKFCYTVVMGSTLNDGNQLRLKTERPEEIEQFLSDQIQKAVEETRKEMKEELWKKLSCDTIQTFDSIVHEWLGIETSGSCEELSIQSKEK